MPENTGGTEKRHKIWNVGDATQEEKNNKKWRGRKLSAEAGVAEEYIEESMRDAMETKKTFEASDTNSNGPPLSIHAGQHQWREPPERAWYG